MRIDAAYVISSQRHATVSRARFLSLRRARAFDGSSRDNDESPRKGSPEQTLRVVAVARYLSARVQLARATILPRRAIDAEALPPLLALPPPLSPPTYIRPSSWKKWCTRGGRSTSYSCTTRATTTPQVCAHLDETVHSSPISRLINCNARAHTHASMYTHTHTHTKHARAYGSFPPTCPKFLGPRRSAAPHENKNEVPPYVNAFARDSKEEEQQTGNQLK